MKEMGILVVPYIGTWIETGWVARPSHVRTVVPYIGTWIETPDFIYLKFEFWVVPYIGTWIETLLIKSM